MFIFDTIVPSENTIRFSYILKQGEKRYSFTETIHLPDLPRSLVPEDLLQRVLQSVHLALGISYWKLFCSTEIQINGYSLTPSQATFWNAVYTKGLGEFFYKNQIDFRGLVSFPSDTTPVSPVHLPRRNRSLVGIGGGKDSIVTAELLKKADRPFDGLVVETQKNYPLVDEVAAAIGVPVVRIRREIDEELFVATKEKGAYDGHIPISAVYAFLGLLTATLYDYDTVVVSNERSSNVGNVSYLGETINHQWSKSAEFEQMMQHYIHDTLTPDIAYLSLLRPYSEYQITKLFSVYPRYFPLFSSCNRNFSIHHQANTRWCGECPKCAFVFVLLAACIDKEQVLSFFGKNMLADKSLLPLYKQLLGLEGIKPFECVGTPEEVTYALRQIHEKGAYEGDPIMQFFVKEF